MASIIKIKRSGNAASPTSLGSGELAYSWFNNTNKLYIGSGTETNGAAANIDVIGGKYFTDMLDHTLGTLTASSAILVDSNKKINEFFVDNLSFDGNTITNTDTDGNLTITANGTGSVVIAKVDINGGTIDGVTIGTNSAVTDLRVDNLKLDANTISTTNSNGDLNLTPDGTGSVVIGKVDINGGAIDGVTIGTNSAVTDLRVDNLKLDGNEISATDTDGNVSLKPNGTGSINANSAKIINLANPVDPQDAATKAYVDASRSGLDVKDSVRAATTANITLSNTQTVDGVALVVGNRVLVKNQNTGSENGIYVVANGAWTRATDFDTDAEVTAGAFFFVTEGTVNQDSGWVLSTDDPIVLGTTALAFAQFSGAGQLIAGEGLSKTGNTLAVNVANGIEIVSDNVQLAATVAGAGLTYTTGVLAVGGTADRIVINADSIDIASNYVGQNTITTLGTIGTGVWQGTIINPTYGGTGVNNGSKTITLGGNLTTAGAFNTTITVTAETALTLPTTGTLSTLAGSETLSNKTLSAPSVTGDMTGTGTSQLNDFIVDGGGY